MANRCCQGQCCGCGRPFCTGRCSLRQGRCCCSASCSSGKDWTTRCGRRFGVVTPSHSPSWPALLPRPPGRTCAPRRGPRGSRPGFPTRARLEVRDQAVHQLLVQSGVALSVMAVASVGLGWWVAGRALRPLRRMTATARSLSEAGLRERIALGGPGGELRELADTFDAMLDRLEAAFDSQRSFVAYASHELRTPLSIRRALLDVAFDDPHAPRPGCGPRPGKSCRSPRAASTSSTVRGCGGLCGRGYCRIRTRAVGWRPAGLVRVVQVLR